MSEKIVEFNILNTFIDFEEINIYRKTSLSPDNFIERKKFDITLHTLEPLGIEIMKDTTFSIIIFGESLKGTAALYVHNVDNVLMLEDKISLNEFKTFTVSYKGELFLDVRNISYALGEDVPFSFKIRIYISDKSKYIITPTIDIRENKIFSKVFEDENEFKDIITANGENGVLMISDNVRLYFPKSKYVFKNIKFKDVISLHEQTLKTFNKLAGLSEMAKDRIDKPRRNFILVSARNQCDKYMTADSTMLATKTINSSVYIIPMWSMFHEYGHLFDQPWGLSDVWNNLYAINMSDKTIGLNWFWKNDRKTFEDKNILKFYDDYFINENEFLMELYFIYTLQEILGEDFIALMTNYYIHNSIELKGVEYIVYLVAKIYDINILPYSEIYGYNDFGDDLKSFVINNCMCSIIYVPKNSSFDRFRNISITPTVVINNVFGNKYIYGISNKNAIINININKNKYVAKADFNGRFCFTIPIDIDESTIIAINSLEDKKEISPTKRVKVTNELSKVSLIFKNPMDLVIDTIIFDMANKSLKVIVGSGKIPSYFIDKVYFTFFLYDNKDNLIIRAEISWKFSVDDFINVINGYKFDYGYYFKITHLERYKCIFNGNVIGLDMEMSKAFEDVDLEECRFYIKPDGVEYVVNNIKLDEIQYVTNYTDTFLGVGKRIKLLLYKLIMKLKRKLNR